MKDRWKGGIVFFLFILKSNYSCEKYVAWTAISWLIKVHQVAKNPISKTLETTKLIAWLPEKIHQNKSIIGLQMLSKES